MKLKFFHSKEEKFTYVINKISLECSKGSRGKPHIVKSEHWISHFWKWCCVQYLGIITKFSVFLFFTEPTIITYESSYLRRYYRFSWKSMIMLPDFELSTIIFIVSLIISTTMLCHMCILKKFSRYEEKETFNVMYPFPIIFNTNVYKKYLKKE